MFSLYWGLLLILIRPDFNFPLIVIHIVPCTLYRMWASARVIAKCKEDMLKVKKRGAPTGLPFVIFIICILAECSVRPTQLLAIQLIADVCCFAVASILGWESWGWLKSALDFI